jgi:hypothetical protein
VTEAGVGSDRARGHLRVVEGDGDLLERSEVSGQPAPRGVAARQPGTPPPSGDRQGHDLRGVFGNGAMAQEPKDLGPPQLDSVRSVPIGTRTDGSGNRVSVKRYQRKRDRALAI